MSQTFKHHTTRTMGALIALVSAPFCVGGFMGAGSTLMGGFLATLGILGAVGLFIGVIMAVLGHRGLRRARRKQIEKEVLRVISVKHGRVTAAEIAAATTLDIEESREILDRFCDMGEGDRAVLPSGKFLYVFDDFLPLDQKEAARNPFHDPLSDLVVE